MTDREILEKAAKAAGAVVAQYGISDNAPFWDVSDDSNHKPWNPLQDDGDALRLVVKLGLIIHVWGDDESVSVAISSHDGQAPSDGDNDAWFFECAHSNGSDLSKATRRAITRAAASLADQ